MRRFHSCQLSWHLLKLPNIYEDVIDANENTCCKLKIDFLKSVFSFRVDREPKARNSNNASFWVSVLTSLFYKYSFHSPFTSTI